MPFTCPNCGSKSLFYWCGSAKTCVSCGAECCSDCSPIFGGDLTFCKECQGTHREYEAVLERFPHNATIWANVARELMKDGGKGYVNIAMSALEEGVVGHEEQSFTSASAVMSSKDKRESNSNNQHSSSTMASTGSPRSPMSAAGTFEQGGEKYVRLYAKNCLERALELKPTRHYWRDLALSMKWGERAYIRIRPEASGPSRGSKKGSSGGVDYDHLDHTKDPSRMMCSEGFIIYCLDTEAVFRNALYLQPKSSELWYALAQKLPPSATFSFADSSNSNSHLGGATTEKVEHFASCLERAIDCDPTNIFAWVLLGVTLKEDNVAQRNKAIKEQSSSKPGGGLKRGNKLASAFKNVFSLSTKRKAKDWTQDESSSSSDDDEYDGTNVEATKREEEAEEASQLLVAAEESAATTPDKKKAAMPKVASVTSTGSAGEDPSLATPTAAAASEYSTLKYEHMSKYSWRECFENAIDLCHKKNHLLEFAAVWANLAAIMEPNDPPVYGRDRLGAAFEAVKCDRENPITTFNLACLLKNITAATVREQQEAYNNRSNKEKHVSKKERGALVEKALAKISVPGWKDVLGVEHGEYLISECKLESTTPALGGVDLFRFMLDMKMPLKLVKMRVLLGLMHPSHPHILRYQDIFQIKLEHLIHRGYEGEVFEGQEVRKNRVVRKLAVKRIPFDFSGIASKQQAILDSMNELSVLLHEKFSHVIVPCHHVAFEKGKMETTSTGQKKEGQGYAHIFMERAEGSLKDFISGKLAFHGALGKHLTVKEEQVLHIAHDILKNLSVLHHYGFVHGDIKPDNVLLFQDGTLRLADFGFSRCVMDSSKNVHHAHHDASLARLDPSSAAHLPGENNGVNGQQKEQPPPHHNPNSNPYLVSGGSIGNSGSEGIGTDGFRAPEVLAEMVTIPTWQVDIFAVGCTLYNLITGYIPDGITADTQDTEWKLYWPGTEEEEVPDHSPGAESGAMRIIENNPYDSRIVELVTRCTAVDPSRRPTCEQLLQMPELTNIVADRTTLSFGSTAHAMAENATSTRLN